MLKTTNIILLCVAIVPTLIGFSTTVMAQSDDAAVAIGETELFPSIRLDFNSTDNVFRTDENEVEADSVAVSPRLYWIADKRQLRVTGEYNGEYSNSSESARDFADHRLLFSGNGELGARHRIGASLALATVNQELGVGLSRGRSLTLDEPIEYRTSRLRVQYDFGASEAIGNIRLGFITEALRYTNQEDITDGFDYNVVTPFLNFSYRLSSDTRAFLELRQSVVDYDRASLDRTESSVLLGVRFNATRKIGGSFALGNTSSDFDVGSQFEDSTLVVEAELEYKPTDNDQINLELERSFGSERGGVSAVNSPLSVDTLADLSWSHYWNTRVISTASLTINSSDETCPNIGNTITEGGLEVGYKFRRWLLIGLTATQAKKSLDQCPNVTVSTDVNEFDYQQTNYGVFLRTSL